MTMNKYAYYVSHVHFISDICEIIEYTYELP